MNILISINDRFLQMAIDLLKSIKLYNEETLNVYLIYDDLSDNTIQILKKELNENKIGNLFPVHYNFSSSNFPIRIPHITRETYFRLYAPYILPKELDRILYLDCDIICTGSLDELYNVDFENNIIAGVENVDPDPKFIEYIKQRIDLPIDNKYINAGVLLINLEKYREHVSINDINSFIKEKYDRLTCQDQDVINKLFYKKIKIIDDRFNYQINHIHANDLDYEEKVLIHYLSPPKPWKENYYLPFHGVPYYRYLKKINELDKLDYLIKYHINNINMHIVDINILLNSIFNDERK